MALAWSVLYLMIVNLPTEEELEEARKAANAINARAIRQATR